VRRPAKRLARGCASPISLDEEIFVTMSRKSQCEKALAENVPLPCAFGSGHDHRSIERGKYMRAVVIHSPGDLRVEEREAALPPGPDEVRVRTAFGGICGSDLHYYNHSQ